MSNEYVLEFFEEEEESAYAGAGPVAPPPIAAAPRPAPPIAPPPLGRPAAAAPFAPAPPVPPPPARSVAPPPVLPPHVAAPAVPAPPLGVVPPAMRRGPLPPRPVAPPPFDPSRLHPLRNAPPPPVPPANRPDPAHVSPVRTPEQMNAPAAHARHQWDLAQVGTREARNDFFGNVKMLPDPARYQVAFHAGDKTIWRQERQADHSLAWQPLDTASVYAHFAVKPRHQWHGEGAQRVHPEEELPHALFGKNAAGQDFHVANPQKFADWFFGSLIWVCAADAAGDVTFYSHIGKTHFHHSSLVSGHGVVGAGEWIVQNGQLLRISGNSGHYRPTIFELYRAVVRMMPVIVMGTTTVFLYDTAVKDWIYVPIADFLADYSRGGRLKTHPESK